MQLAAFDHRPDICDLLLDCGIKPQIALTSPSPLTLAMASTGNSFINRLATYRCLIDGSDMTVGVIQSDFYGHLHKDPDQDAVDETNYLWFKSIELLVGDDLRQVQKVIVRRIWHRLAYMVYHSHHDQIRLHEIPMDIDALRKLQSGYCQIFEVIFEHPKANAISSYTIGACYLEWLVKMGLDPETCVANEMAYSEGEEWSDVKRVLFEGSKEQGWVLGFEWTFECAAPGYTLVSEYTTLLVDNWLPNNEWPEVGKKVYWHHLENKDLSDSRFNRRMAAKERKKRARLGHKSVMRRMPGSWVS